MAEHLSDDEELEKLKQWWRESGKQTLAAIALIIAGYFGWQGWQKHQEQQAYTASELYRQMVEASVPDSQQQLSDEQQAAVTHLAISLIDEHGSSQYGHYARLLMARLAVEDDDLDTAADYLTEVMEDAGEGLSLIARLRLARVEASRGNDEAALALLNIEVPASLSSTYAEVRGDINLMRGDNPAAYQNYNEALAALPPEQGRLRTLLEIKRNRVKPADSEGES